MGLSCFKQLPLNFGYAPLYVDTSAGARLLLGYLITSFNPLDFHYVINSMGENNLKVLSLNVLNCSYAG